jgi:hypothetical protein
MLENIIIFFDKYYNSHIMEILKLMIMRCYQKNFAVAPSEFGKN